MLAEKIYCCFIIEISVVPQFLLVDWIHLFHFLEGNIPINHNFNVVKLPGITASVIVPLVPRIADDFPSESTRRKLAMIIKNQNFRLRFNIGRTTRDQDRQEKEVGTQFTHYQLLTSSPFPARPCRTIL